MAEIIRGIRRYTHRDGKEPALSTQVKNGSTSFNLDTFLTHFTDGENWFGPPDSPEVKELKALQLLQAQTNSLLAEILAELRKGGT